MVEPMVYVGGVMDGRQEFYIHHGTFDTMPPSLDGEPDWKVAYWVNGDRDACGRLIARVVERASTTHAAPK